MTWLSLGDLVALQQRALVTPRVDYTIAFGVSDNPVSWWDYLHGRYLAFRAGDSSEKFIDDLPVPDGCPTPDALSVFLHGGVFVETGSRYSD